MNRARASRSSVPAAAGSSSSSAPAAASSNAAASSASASTSSAGASSDVPVSEQVRQSRKRPSPSSTSSTTVSTVPMVTQYQNSFTALLHGVPQKTITWGEASDLAEFSDFTCSICMESMNEPTITFCGHTYCRVCINDTIDSTGRCPKCGNHLTKEKLCPNFALSDVIARSRATSAKAVKAEVYESSISLASTSSSSSSSSSSFTAPPTDVVKVLTAGHMDQLNLNDLDRLLMVLQRRREIMASDDEEYKRKLLHEFLAQLCKIKNAELEKLNREINLINHDLAVVNSSGPLEPRASTSKDCSKVVSCSSSSSSIGIGIGFNTQPLRNVELETQSLSARKKRMYNHFDDLAQVYLEAKNVEMFDHPLNRSETRMPNGHAAIGGGGDPEDWPALDRFGRTLSHITQYCSLKPLATLSYSADMLSNSNIVSSIEFDKDNEFFAIAGVTKKIKLFEYLNVIGSSVDIHCPSAELSCTAKISCVAWSNYYKNSLASSDYDGCVSLWDVSTCARVRSLGEHEKRVWSVDWSNGDPRLLASGSDDSKVKLWSTNQERSIANLEAKANVCCVKFCPESTYVIAFGSADHCVHYYDFRNPREPLGVLFGHKKAVSYVKFASRDELVSASTDSNLKLWNLHDTMNCVRSFTGHVNEKNFVGLATDGNYVACGSENNSLYLYHKFLPKPLFSFKFDNYRSMLERPKPDESTEFVSAVAWKRGSPVVVAANSQGAIKILELI